MGIERQFADAERGALIERIAELERSLAELASSGSADRWRSAMDAMLEGCQILSHDWRYLYVNPAAEVHNRRPAVELLGRKYAERWPGIEQTEVFERIGRVLRDRVPDRMLNEFTFPDGSVGWFELRFEPVPEGILILSTDVTRRRRAELNLEHLGRVLDSIRRVGRLISTEKDEAVLVQGACEALVETGSFAAAWIATLGPDARVRHAGCAGWSGPASDLLCFQKTSGMPHCWQQARSADGDCLVLHEGALCSACPLGGAGKGDALVAPLRHEGADFGTLGVRMGTDGTAAGDRDLLVQIAADLGLALHDMRVEARRSAYERIVSSAEDGLALIGADHVYLESNASYNRYWNWRSGSLVGRHVREVIGEEFYDKTARHVLARVFAGETVTFELPFDHVEKGPWVADVKCSPSFGPDGAVTGAVIAVRDATSRREAEARIRESEVRLSAIFHRSPVGITFSSLTTGRIQDVNDAGASMFGYTPEEMIGRTGFELGLLEDPRDRGRLLGHLGASGPYHDAPIRVRRRDGEVRDLIVSLERIELGGEQYLLGVMSDQTDRLRAEAERERLEQRMRASQKLEAIGQLAGGVAHDFNNLLVVILNYTDFVLQALHEGDPLRNDLVEVRRAGERAAGLTGQLLAFSRKQVLRPVPFRLNQVPEGLERMLRRILGEDIDLVLELALDAGVVLADPGQLDQVLMNLVVNARDAMPEGGRLRISTRNVQVEGGSVPGGPDIAPGEYVEMTVADSGCGMDDATRNRAFEPFFTTKEPGRGTGLGLSMCYGIVRQSNGYIWIDSVPGQGTTVRIQFPRERLVVQPPVAVVERPPRGSETILLVEDEPALRTLVRRLLASAGYEVLVAEHGQAALELARGLSSPVDLLVTDVVMPRLGGGRVARELKSRWPRLEVLFMSGYTGDEIAKHGVLEEGTHFLAKPFTVDSLLRRVRDVLDARPGAVAS